MNKTRKPIKIVEGIEFFSEDKYWGKAPKDEFEKALKILEESGLEEFKKLYQSKFDFTFEENRADWRFPININKTHTILDIGAGMGRISIPLTRIAGKVIAVDHSFLRMKYLKSIADKSRVGNIETYVGDIFDLPFEKESFDLIVMNGVLEWVGSTNRFSDPHQAQVESLKICKSLLKKGGYLYIGIENRFAFAYVNAIDHSGLRFTSYMPRWFANIYTKIFKGHRYDTYTYNRNGYDKILKEAGFLKNDFYLIYPGYNKPRIAIPYENLNILKYVIKNLMVETGLKRRIANKLASLPFAIRIYRKIFFSFNIFAQK